MLFGKNYDNALWLILAGDKCNRREIFNFIMSIPESVYVSLKKDLRTYMIVKNKYNISNSFYLDDGVVYTYSINSSTEELTLGMGISNGDDYDKVFMLSLMPYDNSLIKLFQDIPLGRILYKRANSEYDYLCDGDMIDYGLIRLPFGLFLKKFHKYAPTIQTRFRRFDMLCANDYDQLAMDTNGSKLVRTNVRKLVVSKTGGNLENV